jgi:hypothetical protein
VYLASKVIKDAEPAALSSVTAGFDTSERHFCSGQKKIIGREIMKRAAQGLKKISTG